MCHSDTSPTWAWARIGAAAIFGMLAVFVSMTILFDPIPAWVDLLNVARARYELPRAAQRWQSRGGPDYQVHVKGAVPLACFVDGEVEVWKGALSRLRLRENVFVPESPLAEVDLDDGALGPCSLEWLTVQGMFERVEQELAQGGLFGVALKVRFDSDLGYVTEYRQGRGSRGGLFGYTVSEFCTWFTFESLKLSDEE
jgi:hypothetical protein